MRIREIINEMKMVKSHYLKDDLDIKNIVSNSGEVKKGDLFVAVKGTCYDGNSFIEEAIKNGAECVISEAVLPNKDNISYIQVEDSRKVLSFLADKFYDSPSKKLKVIGITGTNGKTTTAYLVESILKEDNYCPGIIGTIEYAFKDKSYKADRTTPDALKLNELLWQMHKEGCDSVVMEVSSHSLFQDRVRDIDFDVAVFTNLTHEHLDYHKTMDEYLEAKKKLFKYISFSESADKFGVINIDDSYSEHFEALLKNKIRYGFHQQAEVNLKEVHNVDKRKRLLVLGTPIGDMEIKTDLFGVHSIYNIMAAVSVGIGLNIKREQIIDGIKNFGGVCGRLEFVAEEEPFDVVIDYAHTDDALRAALNALKTVNYEKIILVFGCGGGRDEGKRPLMGKVASVLADYTILTSDNSRDEDPAQIINEIKKGFGDKTNFEEIISRKEAIKQAISLAKQGDCVLIAGKGHEQEQITKKETIHFSDQEVVDEILQQKTVKGKEEREGRTKS